MVHCPTIKGNFDSIFGVIFLQQKIICYFLLAVNSRVITAAGVRSVWIKLLLKYEPLLDYFFKRMTVKYFIIILFKWTEP